MCVKTRKAFGGDPTRVAIHGQSSGGGLVELQYVAPASKGLFRGAISESGGLGASPLRDALAVSNQAANATGCLAREQSTGRRYANKTCMQRLPALNVTSLTYALDWGPVTDGITFTFRLCILLTLHYPTRSASR